MDFFYLVSPERETERIGGRKREYIYNGPPESELSRRGNEIHFFKSRVRQFLLQTFIGNFISRSECEDGTLYYARIRYPFFQSLREGDKYIEIFLSCQKLSDRGSALHSEGRLVIASLYSLSRRGKIEYSVSFNQIVEIRSTILSRFLCGKNYYVCAFMDSLG